MALSNQFITGEIVISLGVITSLSYFFDLSCPYCVGVESTENDQPSLTYPKPSRTYPINDELIGVEDIIDFSFNIGLLEPVGDSPVKKMKVCKVLSMLKKHTVPKGWGWDA